MIWRRGKFQKLTDDRDEQGSRRRSANNTASGGLAVTVDLAGIGILTQAARQITPEIQP